MTNKTISNNLLHVLVIKKQCFCPSDCESTKYIFETSFSPRSPNDTALLIKSYTKKNKLMYNVTKEIQNVNNFCISSEEKEQRIQEFKQLNHSIAFTSTVLHFFWKEDIMVSYKRDERYTIIDMLGKLFYWGIVVLGELHYFVLWGGLNLLSVLDYVHYVRTYYTTYYVSSIFLLFFFISIQLFLEE